MAFAFASTDELVKISRESVGFDDSRTSMNVIVKNTMMMRMCREQVIPGREYLSRGVSPLLPSTSSGRLWKEQRGIPALRKT